MTSASELFFNRRSRLGRNSDLFDIGSDFVSSPPINRRHRQNHHNSHTRRDRLDPEACQPPPRRSRQPPLHRSPSHPSSQERELTRLEQGGQQFASGDVSHSGDHSNGNVRGRRISSENDRLPGSVLLARERLVQRLRGVTLSSRQNNGSASNNHQNQLSTGDDFRLVDAGDWVTEISREWLATITPLTDLVGQQQMTKRPLGLTEEALNCLNVEEFGALEESEHGMSGQLRECSICLESFLKGDELIRLPCGHRYHFCCLDPWVRTCGDCPYCRRSIQVIVKGDK